MYAWLCAQKHTTYTHQIMHTPQNRAHRDICRCREMRAHKLAHVHKIHDLHFRLTMKLSTCTPPLQQCSCTDTPTWRSSSHLTSLHFTSHARQLPHHSFSTNPWGFECTAHPFESAGSKPSQKCNQNHITGMSGCKTHSRPLQKAKKTITRNGKL